MKKILAKVQSRNSKKDPWVEHTVYIVDFLEGIIWPYAICVEEGKLLLVSVKALYDVEIYSDIDIDIFATTWTSKGKEIPYKDCCVQVISFQGSWGRPMAVIVYNKGEMSYSPIDFLYNVEVIEYSAAVRVKPSEVKS